MDRKHLKYSYKKVSISITLCLDFYRSIYCHLHAILVKYFTAGSNDEDSLPIDVSFMREIWSPDAEIRNLKEFRTLNVLSKVRNQYFKF